MRSICPIFVFPLAGQLTILNNPRRELTEAEEERTLKLGTGILSCPLRLSWSPDPPAQDPTFLSCRHYHIVIDLAIYPRLLGKLIFFFMYFPSSGFPVLRAACSWHALVCLLLHRPVDTPGP